MKYCLLLAIACLAVTAYPTEDLVEDIGEFYPTWTGFKMYAGYLDIPGDKHIHYIFVESQLSPASDPVVAWFNGGPGCSSKLGWAQEHGPFNIPDEADEFDPTPSPYSWNKLANMLYIESPAGVGYSYYDGEKPAYNDENVAVDNYETIKAFFAKFTELKDNDFYISGESYAGVYVPYLAHQIAIVNKDTNIKLKGILVGNGVTDEKYDAASIFAMSFWHNIIDKNLEDKLRQFNCYPKELSIYQEPTRTPAPECEELTGQVEMKYGEINIYDVYRKCWHPTSRASLYDTNSLGQKYKVGATA